MKNKTMIKSVLTHLAALAIGLFLAISKRNENVVQNDVSEISSSRTTRKQDLDVDSKSSIAEWRGSQYRSAWNAIRCAKLRTPERIQAQRALLEAWAEVDLTASISAALAEAWDDDHSSIEYVNNGPLLDVFTIAFAKQPDEAWALIQSGQFGVASAMLRKTWIDALAYEYPELVVEKLTEFSWRERHWALNLVVNSSSSDKAKRELTLQGLSKFSKEIVSLEMLEQLLPRELSFKSVADVTIAMSSVSPRVAEAIAHSYGGSIADADDLKSQLAQLPDNMQIAAVTGAMNSISPDESAQFTNVLDIMVNAQAWTELDQFDLPSRMKQSAERGDPALIADWVTKLPVREEFTEAIHRGVEKYVRDNMEESRTWLAQIEEPVWRDRAYAEYSQQALHAKGDAEASRWALDQIQDATFKKEAEAWRSNWEKRK